MNLAHKVFALCLMAQVPIETTSFVVPCAKMSSASVQLSMSNDVSKQGGLFQAFENFWEELDAFMDDASARRLGNGAAFYGKRKSNFYGEKDKNKKSNKDVFDASEDYQGPSSSGYFSWMPDETGQWRPVSRMKNQVLDKRSKN
ncbi:hypothetical protein MPSEU_000891300 [Mayamaea pseudoterrestris]|nr:hypothetical protein MPSEU_000891300 [Mayamaea pseudoterrestris]